MLHINGNWQLTSVVDEISLEEEENADAATATKEEEDLQLTHLDRRMVAESADLKRWMEAAVEAAEINERGIKEAAEEAEVKAAATKSIAFL